MTRIAWRVLAACVAGLAIAAAAPHVRSTASPPAAQRPDAARVAVRESAYRANNIGVARLEQYDFAAAAAAFRQALAADPQLAIARVNLGIALFYAGDVEGARRELEAVRAAVPDRAQPDYVLGLIARSGDRPAEALEAFTRVQRLDPADVGAAVNLGQLHLQERRFADAIAAFRRALEAEPYNATAAYGLGTALVRAGNTDEGRTAMERFQRLRESSYATTYSQAYLEQGRYAEAIASTGAEPELVDPRIPDVAFVDATSAIIGDAGSRPAPGGVALFDLDRDGDLDLVESGAPGVRIYRNDRGRLTADAGFAHRTPASAALPADYDNDGRTDLLVLRSGGLTLYKGDAEGAFADTTAAAGLAGFAGSPRTAAWLDADHDGDLDLIVAGSAGEAGSAARLFRNNGDGRFTDNTAAAGISAPRPIASVVATDYDNRRDIDMLFVTETGRPLLFRNLRDGTFRDAADETGLQLSDGASMAAIGDLNKDGFSDLVFVRAGGAGTIASSDGRGRFTTAPAPAETAGAVAAQLVDYDNDGLLDLLAVGPQGPKILRNLGSAWTDVTSRAASRITVPSGDGPIAFAAGDLDGDGDVDAVVRGASRLAIWRNDGAHRSRSLHLRLTSRVSNRTAVGAKVEMRAGSLRHRIEVHASTPAPAQADVLFAFGDRPGADVVRVLWPSGILQAETARTPPPDAVLAGTLPIEELDRKPSSCPYLFTWTGERFEFLTDFLGGGEMGYWVAPGVRNQPVPGEYVRIPGERLRARGGRLELRVTNELEEALFLDRVQLVAIDHPRDVTVYPNAGLRSGPEPFRIHATKEGRPPDAAVDDHGHDVLDRLSQIDRRYADDFARESVRGYAKEHHLTLTLPAHGGVRRALLLTGWTDYAFSGDNVAAHQHGLRMVPPFLQIPGAGGRWTTAIDNIGFPTGRPQTIVVDLASLPAEARQVRIVTTMRVHWDQVLVAQVATGEEGIARKSIDPIAADLRWRGFSALFSPDGREPHGFTYDDVTPLSPWKLLPGRYTREGDVRELLLQVDDRFVVSRPGDEIAIAFDAAQALPPASGRARTFLLYADGFSKEMDLNSSSPDQLAPLPFHGMPRYPYDAREARPTTGSYEEYLDRYNTRIVKRSMPPLELIPASRGPRFQP